MANSSPKQSDNSKTPDHSAGPCALTDHPTPGELSESIIESLCPGIIAFDTDLKIIQANSQAGKLLDLSEYIDESLSKGSDGKIWGSWKDLLKSVITSGKKAVFKSVRYDHKGHKKLLHIVCAPLKHGPEHRIIGGVIVLEDVTAKIDIEHQLAQAERLAAIGKVAGKVAHELNNPMDGILRYINLAIRIIDAGDHNKVKEYLQQCRSGLSKMVGIISELLEFSRSTYSAFEYAPVDKIVNDAVIAMDSRTNAVEIQILHSDPFEMPRLRGDNLFQVFCNLIKNAIDAMEGKGLLKISIQRADDMLCIEFRDTGPGFPPENAEALFEPFFTTKSPGRGTGLGLAICKDIIEKYNGRITAENTPEGGGVFTVHLPLKDDSHD